MPTTKDAIFLKVEIEASFPGGDAAWSKYITKVVLDNSDKLRKSDQAPASYGLLLIQEAIGAMWKQPL